MNTTSRLLTDADLVAKTLAGEQAAFGQLVERYQTKLLRYAETFTHDPDDAADAVQEAFVKMYEHLTSYDSARSFSAWAYRIVRNESLNWLRRGKRLVTGEAAEQRIELTEALESPELAYAAVERHDLIAKGLAGLPDQYQLALRLRYLEQRSYQEISALLKLPLGTVATHLSRAKSLLKRRLLGAGYDEVIA